jgi:hypothetical protein
MVWLEGWAPPEVVGGRPGGSPATIYYPLAYHIERAISLKTSLITIHADLSKFFDTLPRWTTTLLHKMGMPLEITNAMARIRRGYRCLRFNGSLQPPWQTNIGSPQGDALTIIEAQVIMAIWHRHVTSTLTATTHHKSKHSPTVKATVFIDDRTITFKDNNSYTPISEQAEKDEVWKETIATTIQATSEFDKDINSSLNIAKSKVASVK